MPMGFMGHVRAPHKDHLLRLSELRHGDRLRKLLAAPLPINFDCRALGFLGAIKNQASCGSCWNFSGTCVVEGAYAKAGKLVVLSEQYTMSCGRNGGCNGDDNVTVLEWAKATGLPLTSDYGPYTANSGHCNFKQGMALYKLNDWGFCDGTAGYERVTAVEAIKASMIEHGPIGCAVAAGGSQFWNDGMGTCTGRSTGIDHDVALVAWDDNHDNGDGTHGAWVMRNSWGTGWGSMQGYAWMKYGADSIGTEAVWGAVDPISPPIDFY